MPRKNTTSINTNVTPAQYEFVRDVLAGGRGKVAVYLRSLIIADAKRRGFEWPDAVTPRGKYDRTRD